jgi:hypothetical protein
MAGALDYQSLLFDSAIVSTGANDDLFTLGAGESVDNLTIRFTNYTASAALASIWVQASAGTEADGDRVLNEYSIPADDYRDIDVPRMVGGGNAAKLTVTSNTATALTVSQVSGIKRTG